VEHLEQIKMRPFDYQNLMGVDNSRELVIAQAKMGTAFTGIDDNEGVIAVGGICVLREGVGGGWAITSDLLVKNRIWSHRMIRDIIENGIKYFKLHRIEALIMKEHKVSQRWVERLGFIKEGDWNKDNYLYVRTV